MTADDFISAAIRRGQSAGLASLSDNERFVFLISEAECTCDINGIDTLLDRLSKDELSQCAAAFAEIGASNIAGALAQIAVDFPMRDERKLTAANMLITERDGYDYEKIHLAVARRLGDSDFESPT